MKKSNSDIQTPEYLAEKIVRYYQPYLYGKTLEPCSGNGNIFKFLLEPKFKYEIKDGTDFLKEVSNNNLKFDWIITNPPWDNFKNFLIASFIVSDNVVFLVPINKVLGLKSTNKILKEYNFRIKDIKYWKTPPKPWPQSGFQIGTVWFERGFIDINNLKINFYE